MKNISKLLSLFATCLRKNNAYLYYIMNIIARYEIKASPRYSDMVTRTRKITLDTFMRYVELFKPNDHSNCLLSRMFI